MNLVSELGEIFRFSLRQSSGFLEILKLKIRIIGFSNKRSGVMTRLGEAVHKTILEGGFDAAQEHIKKLSAEAKDADEDILASEFKINAKREILKEDWEAFKSRFKDDASLAGDAGRSVNPDEGRGNRES